MESGAYKLHNEFLKREVKKYHNLTRLKHFLLGFIKACANCAEEGDTVKFLKAVEDMAKPMSNWLATDKIDISKLSDIHYSTIRQLIFQVINETGVLPQIELKLEVTAPICKLVIKEDDLFQVLSFLFDNALDEVRGQEKGFLRIQISEDFDSTIITVSNSTIKKKEKDSLSFGKKFQPVLQTISPYKEVNINTKLLEGKHIQQLMIGKR